MKNEPQTIEQILKSFEHYGLGDIKHNRGKTIAAFILSICFIDQLASFRYRNKKGLSDQWESFIIEYMPTYRGLNIYTEYRNTLIHNYSTRGKLAMTNDPAFQEPFKKEKERLIINTSIFIEKLIEGFEKLKIDFSIPDSEANRNALKRSIKHPVVIHRII